MAPLTDLIGILLGAPIVGAALGGAFLLGRHSRKQGEGSSARGVSDAATETNTHLADLASTMDSLVHEVERVAEARRYTARLLTDQIAAAIRHSPQDPIRIPGRVITPH